MAEAHDRNGMIYQNLLDAGCNQKMIEKCMAIVKNGNYFEMLPLLSLHKADLLNQVRLGQKKIDCLDYLVFRIKERNS